MENELNNQVSILGNYNEIPTEINSNVLVVTMVNGLTVTKSCDKMIWADGLLTFTIVVNNETEKEYTNPVITDILNTYLVLFVDDSVSLNGTKLETSSYTYESSTGKLTINLPNLEPKQTSTITFQVKKTS